MLKTVLRMLFGILLMGWVFPAWLGDAYWRTAIEQSIAGTRGHNSFPYEQVAHQLLAIAAVWLALSGVAIFFLVLSRSGRKLEELEKRFDHGKDCEGGHKL